MCATCKFSKQSTYLLSMVNLLAFLKSMVHRGLILINTSLLWLFKAFLYDFYVLWALKAREREREREIAYETSNITEPSEDRKGGRPIEFRFDELLSKVAHFSLHRPRLYTFMQCPDDLSVYLLVYKYAKSP